MAEKWKRIIYCITTTSRIRHQSIMLDNCLIKIKYSKGDSVVRSTTVSQLFHLTQYIIVIIIITIFIINSSSNNSNGSSSSNYGDIIISSSI